VEDDVVERDVVAGVLFDAAEGALEALVLERLDLAAAVADEVVVVVAAGLDRLVAAGAGAELDLLHVALADE
jgi:hypothetical protein